MKINLMVLNSKSILFFTEMIFLFEMVLCADLRKIQEFNPPAVGEGMTEETFKGLLKNGTTVEINDPIKISVTSDDEIWFSDKLVDIHLKGQLPGTVITIECMDADFKSFSLFNNLENSTVSNIIVKVTVKNQAKLHVEEKFVLVNRVVNSYFNNIQVMLPDEMVFEGSNTESSGILAKSVISSTMLQVAIFFGKLESTSLSSIVFGTVSEKSYIGNAIVQGKTMTIGNSQNFGVISGMISVKSVIADSVVDIENVNINININSTTLIKRSIGLISGSVSSLSKIFNTVVIVRDRMKISGNTLNVGILAGKVENSEINNCFAKVFVEQLYCNNNNNNKDVDSTITIGSLVGEVFNNNNNEDKVMMVNNHGLITIDITSADKFLLNNNYYGLYIGKINRGVVQIVNSYISLVISDSIKDKIKISDVANINSNNDESYVNIKIKDVYYIIKPNNMEVTLHSKILKYDNILEIKDKLKNYDVTESKYAYYKHTPKWDDEKKILSNFEIGSQSKTIQYYEKSDENVNNKGYNYAFIVNDGVYCSSPLNSRYGSSNINDYPSSKYVINCIQKNVEGKYRLQVDPKPQWIVIDGYTDSSSSNSGNGDTNIINNIINIPPTVNIYTVDIKEGYEGETVGDFEFTFSALAGADSGSGGGSGATSENYMFRYNEVKDENPNVNIEPIYLQFGSIELKDLEYTVTLENKLPTSAVTIKPTIPTEMAKYYIITPTEAVLNQDNSYTQNFKVTPIEVVNMTNTVSFTLTHTITTTDESYKDIEIPEITLRTIVQDESPAPDLISIKESNSSYEVIFEFNIPCYVENVVFECGSLFDIDVLLLSSVEGCIWNIDNKNMSITMKLQNNTIISPDTVIIVKPNRIKSSKNSIYSLESAEKSIELRAPIPEVISARFIDGSKINITFNTPIKEGITSEGIFCSKIFNDTTILDSDNKDYIWCYLNNYISIIIQLSYKSEIVPGDELVLLGGIMKSAVNHLYSMPETVVTILAPEKLPELKAIINHQPKVLYCKKLVLDGSQSTGSPGRPLKYRWKLTSPVNETISEYLQTDKGIIEFPPFLFEIKKYKFSLEVKSFLSSNTHTKEVEIDVTSEPFVNTIIEGPSEANVHVDQFIFIKSKVTYEYCGNDNKDNIPIMYNWKVTTETSEEIPLTTFVNSDPTRIGVNGSKLDLGEYNFKITGSKGELHKEATCKVTISIKNLGIGPAYPLMQTVYSNETVVVGVRETNDKEKIEYKWSSGSFNLTDYDVNKKEIKIEKDILKKGEEYIFNLKAKGGISNKVKKLQFKVTVKDTSAIIVNIENLIHPSNIFSVSDVITLTTNIRNFDPINYNVYTYKWSYLNNPYKSPFLSNIDRNSVFIDCSTLSPYSEHTIELKVVATDSSTGFYKTAIGRYTFTVSLPPQGGYIVVPKIDQYEFGVKYTLSTTGWSSNIAPLRYRFGVYKDNTVYYLQSVFGTSPSYYGILPFGSAYDNYTLIPIVFVQDVAGGIVNTTLTSTGEKVKIYAPPIVDQEKLKATLNETLNGLIVEQDFDQMYNLIGSVSDQYKQSGCDDKCQNGGECEEFICRCKSGFYGLYCENHIPINGGWSKDYYYTECKDGKRLKYRICNDPLPQYGGSSCGQIKYEEEKCSNSVDSECKYSGWSNWSECKAECEKYNGDTILGTQTRTKTLLNNNNDNNNNNLCVNIRETKECKYKCNSPKKLCPGQVLSNDGKIKGNECNNHGTCERSRENCTENEPTCLSYCNCNKDYYGDDCSKTETEYEAARNVKQQLIESLFTANKKVVSTPEAMEQQSATILSVLDPPSDLREEAKESSLDIIENSIKQLRENKPKSMSYEALSNYVKASAVLLKDEWIKEDKKRRMRMRRGLNNDENSDNDNSNNNNGGIVGNKIVDMFDNIAKIHNSQQYSPPLSVETDIVSMNLVRVDPSYDYESIVEMNGGSANIDVSGAIDQKNGGEEIQVMNWAENPKGFDSDRLKRESSILSIKISTQSGGNITKGFKEPIYFTNKVNGNAKLKDIKCTYYDGNELSSKGVMVVGLIEENGEKLVLCSAIHLTDFAAQLKAVIPKMNFVNPVGDAHLLGNYNKSNMIVPIILGVILVVCIGLWFYSKYRDYVELSSVTEEKAARFLKYGYLVNKNEGMEEIKANKGKKSLWELYKQKLTHTHTWLAPEFKTIDELIVVNRSQHILCLTAQVLTSLAVNALFFGNDSENIGQLIMTSIISTLVMLPCTVLIPLIYKYANGYKSKTISKRMKFSFRKLIIRIKTIFNSLSTANKDIYKLQISLYILTGVFDIVTAIFFITFMIIIPQGYMTLILAGFFLLFIIETVACFFASGTQNKRYFLYLFCLNFVFTFFFSFLFIFYIIGMSSPDSAANDIWNGFYQLPGLKDLLSYTENILHCCGYNDVNDHNVNECSIDTIRYSHGEDVGCKDLLHDKLVRYAPAWLIYFVISLLVLIPKMVVLFKYLTYKFSSIIPDLKDDNMYYHQKDALEKITNLFRRRLFQMRYHREREYVAWTRQRRLRSSVVMLANVFVFLYILIMIYINLLYGVKFVSSMATTWIISSVISVLISLIVQEPSMILLNTVATSTLGVAFRI